MTDSMSGRIGSPANIVGHISKPTNTDYLQLKNLPKIEGVELVGNKSMADFGDRSITNTEIQDILNSVFT